MPSSALQSNHSETQGAVYHRIILLFSKLFQRLFYLSTKLSLSNMNVAGNVISLVVLRSLYFQLSNKNILLLVFTACNHIAGLGAVCVLLRGEARRMHKRPLLREDGSAGDTSLQIVSCTSTRTWASFQRYTYIESPRCPQRLACLFIAPHFRSM